MTIAFVPDCILVAAAILLALYVFGTWSHDYFTKLSIPFSKPLPVFGNMAPVMFRRANIADHISNIYTQCGGGHKMVGFFEFNTPLIMLKDPDLIKQIAVKDFDYFMDHRIAVTEDAEPLLGRTLFALKGERWRSMRAALSPAFTSSKMKGIFTCMEQCGIQMADHLSSQCKASADGMMSFDVKDFYTRFTNDVIASAAFGVHCDSLENPNNEFYLMGKDMTNMGVFKLLKYMLLVFCPKVLQISGLSIISKKTSDFFRKLVLGTIARREKEGIVRRDMIQLMMQARRGTLEGDEDDDVTQPQDIKKKPMILTDDDITAQGLVFFLAGFDTTATALSFTSLLLTLHPDVQRRAREEVDAVLDEDGGRLTYEGVQRMKYLDMVISESLRLYPPAPNSDRQCVRPYVMAATDTTPSIRMNVGDGIWIPMYAIHRDPEYFPDPERFDPERFGDENKHNINQYTYMPFGVGPRNCLGIRFAQLELKVALANVLSRFTLEVVKKTPTQIVLTKSSFPTAPIGGFWVGIKPRTDVSAN